jgi:hypothetical protein
MVSPRSRSSAKHRSNTEASAPNNEEEDVRGFLERQLPRGKIGQAEYLTDALREAGERYDRYIARKKEWWSYAHRRNRLNRITYSAKELVSELCELDVLTRDELAVRLGTKQIEALVGSLAHLSTEATDLSREVQENGKPRDLAEERWILELADIYENAFDRPARVWGSGAGPIERRGQFYRLLELCRPSSFFRYGKLSPRQIDRTLKHRRTGGTLRQMPEVFSDVSETGVADLMKRLTDAVHRAEEQDKV